MNQKTIDAVKKVFYETNFANKFAWPMTFKFTAYMFELNTKKFVNWFNSLKLPVTNNVWVNTVDTSQDREVIYSEEDFNKLTYGECIARSIAIPAFIEKYPFIDGGVAQNPCLTQWEKEELPIFVSQLMMPVRISPKGRLEKLFYSWEFSAFQKYLIIKEKFNKKLKTFYPMINDVDSTDFGISKEKKIQMVEKAYKETLHQLEFLGMKKQPEPVNICLALSGGGIRSGAHIGVVQALYEYNYHPVKWSGTSGGAAFSVLFAGYEKLLGSE